MYFWSYLIICWITESFVEINLNLYEIWMKGQDRTLIISKWANVVFFLIISKEIILHKCMHIQLINSSIEGLITKLLGFGLKVNGMKLPSKQNLPFIHYRRRHFLTIFIRPNKVRRILDFTITAFLYRECLLIVLNIILVRNLAYS